MQHLRRLYLLKVRKFFLVIVILFVALLIGKSYLSLDSFMRNTGISPVFFARLIFDTGSELKSTDERTNLLVLGIGGGTHEGPDLSDTMIVLSFNMSRHSLALISVPRDIWSNSLNDKINSAYHYGELKKKGGGMILAKAIVEDVVGLPVHYAMVLDFSQFQKVIDIVGGVDINVPAAFTDNEYPIAGKENDLCGGDTALRCRYQTIHFDKGLQHMDGEQALKYVRSRHAEGGEGSDFARNRRQQDLLVALKQKLVNPFVWLPPNGFTLFQALDDATNTDLNLGEFITIGRLFAQTKQTDIEKISFSDLLINPPTSFYNGLYVLAPKTSFQDIHEYIKSQLK